jgi:predicted dehydrogenase
MANLRAGLVGLGMMGRNHARVLSSLEGVDLVGVADPVSPVEVPGTVDRLQNLDGLLALKLDYVVIAAPTAAHAEIAQACAEQGVHVLVEKPLTTDVAEAQRLKVLFDDAGLIGAVGHIERYNPALQQAKHRLAEGDLGDVYQIITRRQGPFPGRIADVGVILDLASHDFDLTAWVAGSPYANVFARTAHRSGRPHEDLVAVTAQLENGTVTNHLVNWVSPLKERVTVITGEKGSFVADTLSADLTFFENGIVPTQWSEVARFRGVAEGNVTRYAFPKPEPLRVEHEMFRDAVLGLPADIVTFEQGARTVAVANACARSAAQRQAMDVEV